MSYLPPQIPSTPPPSKTSITIWQPGGTPSANTYTTWASVYAATLPGATIYIDPTYARPQIPSGTWSNVYALVGVLGNYFSGGNSGQTLIYVDTLDGCVLPNLTLIDYGVFLNVIATTVCPIIRGDNTTLFFSNGGSIQVDPSSTLPAIRFTPGDTNNGSANGPNVICRGVVTSTIPENSVYLGSGNSDFEINPVNTMTSNLILIYLTGYSILNGSWVTNGTYAINANAIFYFLDLLSASNSSNPLTFSGFTGNYNFENKYSNFTYQFGSASSGTSGSALTAYIPFGNSATCPTSSQIQNNVVIPVSYRGFISVLSVSLVGSNTSSNPTTFQLFQNNSPVGGNILIDVGLNGFQNGYVANPIWYQPGDIFSIQFVTTSAVATPFTQINATLF